MAISTFSGNDTSHLHFTLVSSLLFPAPAALSLSLSQLSDKITFIYHPISKSILEHSVKPPQEAKSIPLTELHLEKRTASIPTIKLSLALLPTSPNHISHITYEPPPTHPLRLPGPNPQHLNHPQPTTSSSGNRVWIRIQDLLPKPNLEP